MTHSIPFLVAAIAVRAVYAIAAFAAGALALAFLPADAAGILYVIAAGLLGTAALAVLIGLRIEGVLAFTASTAGSVLIVLPLAGTPGWTRSMPLETGLLVGATVGAALLGIFIAAFLTDTK